MAGGAAELEDGRNWRRDGSGGGAELEEVKGWRGGIN